MKESILTIPINEVFDPRSGCPVCRMRDTVEAHISEYIMGAAMMEPDVRIETNEQGFCFTHFEMLLAEDNRLSLGLMIKSYLEINKEKLLERKKVPVKKGIFQKRESEENVETCFVCSKVDWGINRMTKTIFTLFKESPEFRRTFSEQEFFCLPHYKFLLQRGRTALQGEDFSLFAKTLDEVLERSMTELNRDVKSFCDSFDYRNAGTLHQPGMEKVKLSVPLAIRFLTGREPEEMKIDDS